MFLKIFKNIIKRKILIIIEKEKANIIKTINDKIDIPEISEQEEEIIFNKIYDFYVELLIKIINKL